MTTRVTLPFRHVKTSKECLVTGFKFWETVDITEEERSRLLELYEQEAELFERENLL